MDEVAKSGSGLFLYADDVLRAMAMLEIGESEAREERKKEIDMTLAKMMEREG